MTKKYKHLRDLFGFLSFLCNFGLVIFFFIFGLVNGTTTTKYTMCLTGIVGIIVALVSVILKKHWRTPLILLLVGLFFVVNQYAVVLFTVGIGIILDEFIFEPLYQHYREKTSINREIDSRIGA